MNDLRAVYEAVAFGEDDRISPADRLKAADQLAELNKSEGDPKLAPLSQLMATVPEVELDNEFFDPEFAHVVEVLCGNSKPEHEPYHGEPLTLEQIKLFYPETTRIVTREVERRANEIAAARAGEPKAEPTAASAGSSDDAGHAEPAVEETQPVETVRADASSAAREGREPFHGWPGPES